MGILEKPLIICVTGMPGAGKSTVADAMKPLGFQLISMGEVVREETARRNMPLTDNNVGAVMIDLREKRGPRAVAELCIPKIKQVNGSRIVIDGVRSTAEMMVFTEFGLVKVLGVHASPEIRYRYLLSRSREDVPVSREVFDARDERELNVGVGAVFALSDEIISNNSIVIEELRHRAISTAKMWLTSDED